MENGDVAYIVTHTRKHKLADQFTQVASAPLVDDVLAGLWVLRKDPRFFNYETREESTLGDLIGFDVEGSEIDKPYGFGFCKEDRDIYRKLAEPQLIVPDVTDRFTRGLLTDVVKATRERILRYGKLFEDGAKTYLERKRLDIGVERLREIFADQHAYAAFLIGYCFPRLGRRRSCRSKYTFIRKVR